LEGWPLPYGDGAVEWFPVTLPETEIIMPIKRKALKAGQRIAVHRKRRVAAGIRRIEVAVPAADAPLVRQMAAALRDGGADAMRLRSRLTTELPAAPTPAGSLVDFLQSSPLRGLDLDDVRDRSLGRDVDLSK
jgi:hypothetical protein